MTGEAEATWDDSRCEVRGWRFQVMCRTAAARYQASYRWCDGSFRQAAPSRL